MDAHYDAAMVRACVDFSALFPELVDLQLLSCDDKAKVKVGSLAVSRYFQIRRFFSTTDSVNYDDQDFPHSGYLLVPSGYLKVDLKILGTTVDALGHGHEQTILN